MSSSRFSKLPEDSPLNDFPTFVPYGLDEDVYVCLQVRVRIEELGIRIKEKKELIQKLIKEEREEDVKKEKTELDKLILLQHRTILTARRINTKYQPPDGYTPPPETRKNHGEIQKNLSKRLRPGEGRYSKKIFIPVEEYPNYNFSGLIIGPRGKTQKIMENETGCKVSLRGKGSVPPGKARHYHVNHLNEPLHVLLSADNAESLELASDLIDKLLIPVDESQNDLKRMQLRELARIQGTLRDTDDKIHEDIFSGQNVSLVDRMKEYGTVSQSKNNARPDLENAINEFIDTVDKEMPRKNLVTSEKLPSKSSENVEIIVEESVDEDSQQEYAFDPNLIRYTQPPPPGDTSDATFSYYQRYFSPTRITVESQFPSIENEELPQPPIPGVDLLNEHDPLRNMVYSLSSFTQRYYLFGEQSQPEEKKPEEPPKPEFKEEEKMEEEAPWESDAPWMS